MRNFVAKFGKILEICKKFAENQVNERGNVTRCGVVPTFSDLEVVALSITAEAFSIDSENYLLQRKAEISCKITEKSREEQNKLVCFFCRDEVTSPSLMVMLRKKS